jgi:valyl-tRNA synthetase
MPEKMESLHQIGWPTPHPEHKNQAYEKEGDLLVAVISAIRRLKSEKGISMKTPIKKLGVYCEERDGQVLEKNSSTITKTCNVDSIVIGRLNGDLEARPVEGYSVKIKEEST